MKTHTIHAYFCYLFFEIRRAFRSFRKMLAAVCLLSVVCGLLGMAFFHTSDRETAASPYTVVIVLPKNAGLHYSLAVSMVGQMDSFQGMCSIVRTDEEAKARAMLESGEAAAAVIIPEGMIHSIRDGSNLPAVIICPADPSRETALFGSIVSALSRMLSIAQSGVYSLYDIYESFHVSDEAQKTGNSELNSLYINYVLDRSSLFSKESVSFDAESPSWLSFACGALCLLLLLTGISLTGYFSPESGTLSHALSRIGIGCTAQSLIPVIAAWLAQMTLYIPVFLIAGFLNSRCHLLTGLTFSFLAVLGICVFFASALQAFLCRLCRTRESAIIFLFLIPFLLVFAAGGLLPMAFLPSLCRSFAAVNPVYHLQKTLSAGLCGAFSSVSVSVLLLWSVLLSLFPVFVQRTAQFLSVPAGDKPAAASKMHFPACGTKHFPSSGKSRFFAWLSFLFKRCIRRPTFSVLLLAVILSGLVIRFYDPGSAAVSVAVFCENPDSFTEGIIDRLLKGQENSLYRFYLSDSLASLREDVLWGKAECGYVFPDSFSERLEKEETGCILTCTSPSTVLSNLIQEDVFCAVFEAYAPHMLSDYILQAGQTAADRNSLDETAKNSMSSWQESGNTFHTEYEDIPENFFDSENAFHLPLRGIFSLLPAAASMAGMSQFRHDRRKGLYLIRSPQEQIYLPCLCSLIPTLLCAAAGLAALYLSGEGGSFPAEAGALLLYTGLLTVMSSVLSSRISSDLAFDALIPLLIIFCLIYTPVFTDLSPFLPGGKILTYLVPSGWYLHLF